MISFIRNKPGGLRLWVCVRVIRRHLTWHTGGVQGQDVILRASSDIWVPTKLNTEPRNHQSLKCSLYACIITDNKNAPIWGLKMRYFVLTACPRLLWHFNKQVKLCVRKKMVPLIWCNQALQLVQAGRKRRLMPPFADQGTFSDAAAAVLLTDCSDVLPLCKVAPSGQTWKTSFQTLKNDL